MTIACVCGTKDVVCICSGHDADCPGKLVDPCVEFLDGMNGRCAFCDHGRECHRPVSVHAPALEVLG